MANLNINTAPLLFGRSQVVGSLIGGIKETQKMFLDDYCSLNEEYCDCYISAVQNEINEEFAIKALTTSRWSATEEELEKWREALENAEIRIRKI
mgnify:CR=1 FL=1